MKQRMVFFLIVVGAIYGLCFCTLAAPQSEPPSGASKLQHLLTQRRDVLKGRFQAIEAVYRNNRGAGSVSLEDYVAAHNQLLMAEFELSSDKRQCLDFLQHRIDNFRALEELAEATVKRGLRVNALVEKADRLQAEIDYVREESKED